MDYQLHRVVYSIECAKRAIELDQKHQWGEALVNYKVAYTILLAEASATNTPKAVAVLFNRKADEYLDRIDDLKKYKPVPKETVPEHKTSIPSFPSTATFGSTTSGMFASLNKMSGMLMEKNSVDHVEHSTVLANRETYNATMLKYNALLPKWSMVIPRMKDAKHTLKNIAGYYESKILLDDVYSKAIGKLSKNLCYLDDGDGNQMLTLVQDIVTEEASGISNLTQVYRQEIVAKIKLMYDAWEHDRDRFKDKEKKSVKELTNCEAVIEKMQLRYDRLCKDLEIAQNAAAKGTPLGPKELAKLIAAKDKAYRERDEGAFHLVNALIDGNKVSEERIALINSLVENYFELDFNRVTAISLLLKHATLNELTFSTKIKGRYQLLMDAIARVKLLASNSAEKDIVINYDWIEKRFKVGKTSCKSIINYLEQVIMETERYYEGWNKVLRSAIPCVEEKTLSAAWKEILHSSNIKMNLFKNFSVTLLKEILSPFNVLLNKIRSTKTNMDSEEKDSLKKLHYSESLVTKVEANLAKARRDDASAAKDYEKTTAAHKDPTKAMEKMSITGSDLNEIMLQLANQKKLHIEAMVIRDEELNTIISEADELEDSRLLNYKELLSRLAAALNTLYAQSEKADSTSNIMANQISAENDCKELNPNNVHWKY